MQQNVRLSKIEVQKIVEVIRNKCALVDLKSIAIFGSRADLTKKGGDIDLLLEFAGAGDDLELLARQCRAALHQEIGEQKIDLVFWNVLREKNSERQILFYDMIKMTSVNIWESS